MIGNLSSKQYAEATTDAEREFWKEGGTGPTILHAIAGGLLGGVTDFSGMLSGALGGASSAYLAPKIKELVAEFVKEAGLSGSAADFMTNSITGSILQGLGGVTGGTGAAYAGNAYQNNYLKHEEIIAYNDEMRQCGENPDCQYRVFSEYFEISANRNDEVASCETEECRKAHYDDFMKAKEVANLILNPFNHNNDSYYTALLTLQSNEVNAAVNHIAMARVQARNDAREQCGSDDACTQRYADEYFQLWADEKDNKQLLGFVGSIVLGVKPIIGGNAKNSNIRIVSAEEANNGYAKPPYNPNRSVKEFPADGKNTYVRVYTEGTTNQGGSWMMRLDDIKGLTPQQIADKFDLPYIPTHVTDVSPPKGTIIRTGTVNPGNFGGSGGGTQFELQTRIPDTAFTNPRKLP